MHETGKRRGIAVSRPAVLLAMAMLLMSGIALGGPFHHGKVETTVNLSQGYRHGDTIFFLADVHRFQKGRTFWLIMPFNIGPKTLSHRTMLYSLRATEKALKLESVLSDPAEPTCMVSNTKWVLKDGGLFIVYNPSNRISPETGHTERIVFRRDMASGKVEAVLEPEKVHAEVFAAYRSPYRENPGIVEISEYKKLLPPDFWEKSR